MTPTSDVPVAGPVAGPIDLAALSLADALQIGFAAARSGHQRSRSRRAAATPR